MAREKVALPYSPGYQYPLCSSCRSEDDGTWPKDASVGHPKLSHKGFPSESLWAGALPPPDPSLVGLLSQEEERERGGSGRAQGQGWPHGNDFPKKEVSESGDRVLHLLTLHIQQGTERAWSFKRPEKDHCPGIGVCWDRILSDTSRCT